ncbi:MULTISPECIES: 4'-phosphopantetheinyl transferase family protein [unclassified Corynebacterium]|uniref:4'-phosphopantetheinyl transferase family protein n=1 Tax=unclassified Corynebacterium TaxID=2624378 RepID=UPI0029CA51D7|nr:MULTISPECIES: 4'-phosphopantetheinyl transferase superfamily protein [unclassified Corynebacterium]WPF65288.1 4'-phosphopantetheinyl transferase superfamily protein [Corynebacterium sp. 22KM0430]WPF67783.1 4'-phosphopantetheinyl transferase superfamily protein [Corynebacterium sp. 21KM1197]
MMDSLFPPQVQWRILRAPDSSLLRYQELPAEERELVARAVDKRKAEFGDARWCAHQALAHYGVPPSTPILRGVRGMPVWPQGFTGSLTHTEGLRAAAVAPRSEVRAVGLDVEPAAALPKGVLGSIALDSEEYMVRRWWAAGMQWADRLLFCAKEATYKAWFPLTRRWLDFDQAEIALHPDGTFTSRLLPDTAPLPFFSGRWLVREGYCCAAITVPL